MRRAGLLLAAVLATGSALLACDSIFGIQSYPDLPGEAGTDATMDVAEVGADAPAGEDHTPGDDAKVDASVTDDATVDAGTSDSALGSTDAADAADSSTFMCPPQCNGGETRCAAGGLETCVDLGNNCWKWSAASCPTGQTCWGVPYTAYCCAGGPSVCAPSCHVLATGSDAGNGQNNCGRGGDESCCTSLDVGQGTFLRSYDGVNFTDGTNPATISTFALDKFEVSVGRFRQFFAVANAGWVPADGSGIHTHLNAGQGLFDSSQPDGGTYEQGWSSSWDIYLPGTAHWGASLEGNPSATWTDNPGPYEAYGINSVNWYMAYAFCIWDGGFLPSETEWNYAASGGTEQRAYPWSVPSNSTTIGCSDADYTACANAPALLGIYTNGYGLYGQADLAGGEWEWTLDYYQSYQNPCVDCAYLTDPGTGQRNLRGGSWNYTAQYLYASTRLTADPTLHFSNDGFRCARPP